MGSKGLDFKHKEVINIKDGRRMRICAKCNSRFRKWNDYIYNGCKIENRYSSLCLRGSKLEKATKQCKEKKGQAMW